MREQLHKLDEIAPSKTEAPLGLSGIFLTHAHIGHYAGLIFVAMNLLEQRGLTSMPCRAWGIICAVTGLGRNSLILRI